MRRYVLPLAAACALTAVSIVTAFAHSTLEKAEAPAGSYKAVLRIPHGCDGQATHTVRIDLPEGFIGAKPMPKAGWQVATEKGDYAKTYKLHGKDVSSGLKSVTWSGGDLPDDFYEEFVVNGSLSADPGAKLPFIVTQLCKDGQVAWNEIAAEGQDPHSLKHPAPFVTIAAAADDGHGGHMAADAVKVGDLTLTGGWLRAMLPGQPAGGGFVTIANGGSTPDRMIGVSTTAAGKSEMHTMEIKNDVMVMRPVEGGIEIPAGQTVELKPGGLHLMFMQVKEPFKEGATIAVTLEFEKAGKVELQLPVKAAADAHGH